MRSSSKQPKLHSTAMIGVFDSGYGGLTILRALIKELPQYSYWYLGDTKRAPYGDRTTQEIYEFTRQGVDYLFKQGSTLVILACNTASAVALRKLQQEWLPTHYPDRRILGILVPTVEQITGVPWASKNQGVSATAGTITIGVLGTAQTIISRAYELEIHKRNPSLRVIQQACPGLVETIEAGEDEDALAALVKNCVDQLQEQASTSGTKLSAVLLGCTHYELIAGIIRQQLPPSVRLYNQPAIVAASLATYLTRNTDLAAKLEQTGERVFLTTGDPVHTSQHSARYFGEAINFEPVVL